MVTRIDQEHAEYRSKRELWKRYQDLYTGGEGFKLNSANYLIPRQKEPADVYGERLNRVFYENYIGSIIDWYAATLFRREPVISLEGTNESARTFFSDFIEDCDRKGTNLSDFYRRQITDALVYGVGYALVDFPRTNHTASSRAEEELLGASRAYLVHCNPEELVNWSRDEHGNFEWIVLRTTHSSKRNIEDTENTIETRWIYYDRERFKVYRRTIQAGVAKQANSVIELVDEGIHGLAKLGRVPLFEFTVSQGMWLMNKAALLQLEHFNKSNALSWALTMGLFAMPVVYSDKKFDQMVGESYFLQLGPGDRFGWTEPEGKVFEIATQNLHRLKDEIYRVCYLIGQAGPVVGDSRPVSGLAKQRDFAITQEVLRSFGDSVKDVLKRVLKAIENVREDGLQVNVSGLDEFDIGDFASEVDDASKLMGMDIDSPTLAKQVYKKLAFKYLCDERQDIKDTIAREIDDWFLRGVK
jgi:hypothetical protein